MGNTPSTHFEHNDEDVWWTNGLRNASQTDTDPSTSTSNTEKPNPFETSLVDDQERLQHRKELTENLNEFRQELARKHEKRRQLIAEKRKEMFELREEFEKVKKENEELHKRLSEESCDKTEEEKCTCNQDGNGSANKIEDLKNQNEGLRILMGEMQTKLVKSVEIADKNNELRKNIAEMQTELQALNTEILQFQEEREDYKVHVVALKDVIKVSKDLLKIRENQINELRQKITEIEQLLSEREAELLSENLKQEYEKQLNNIRRLKTLYEERQRADKREKDALNTQLEENKRTIEIEQRKNSELEERIKELEEDNSKKYDRINSLESNLGLSKAECRELQAEMTVINQLFSQILLSFNSCQEFDLENMIKILEENHDLLTDMVVNEESNEVSSALPKTLLDLVNQVKDKEKQKQEQENSEESPTEEGCNEVKAEKLETIVEESESQTPTVHQLNSAEEIVENLPKVWKVLIELLSHQSPPPNVIIDNIKDSENPCYKSVQTPTGTKLVVSVSKTFIRLKDLILEKKSLEKEMGRLKHLNGHLECRLQDQEKRLETVSSELSKTWHVVGKMQRQHQQLHTQEKILRYELAQKRKLLTELKEELEYCREKWIQAREKNSSTEEQWRQLRTEFASRKTVIDGDLNNSVESGYSDEKSSSDSDDHDDSEADTSEEKKHSDDEFLSCDKMDKSDDEQLEANINKTTSTDISTEFEFQSTPVEDSSILEVVKTEIAKIEGILENENEVQITTCSNVGMEEASASSCTNGEHSVLKSKKTDLVQSSKDERQEVQNETVDNLDKDQIVACSSSEGRKNAFCSQSEDVKPKEESLMEIEGVTEGNQDEATGNCSSAVNSDCTSEGAISKPLDEPEATTSKPKRTPEEMLATREARLKRLEEQCQQLVTKVTNTSHRSVAICNKLENLHGIYGDSSNVSGGSRRNSVDTSQNKTQSNSESQEEESK